MSRHIDMNVNKLISLKKQRLTPGDSKNVCFAAATTRSTVLRNKVRDIHHVRKP